MPDRKPLEWWGDALDVLRSCPDEVKQRVGFALDEAQLGGKAGSAKPMNSVGKGVFALTTNHRSETYRTFYVAHFEEAVYCFYIVHKKATHGINLPQHLKDLASARYRAIVDWRKSEGLTSRCAPYDPFLLHFIPFTSMNRPVSSSGNVFADLGYDSETAELLRFKGRLLSAVSAYVSTFTTQAEAAEALGVSRPRISEIRNGHLDKFSADLLLTYCHRAGLRLPDFELVATG